MVNGRAQDPLVAAVRNGGSALPVLTDLAHVLLRVPPPLIKGESKNHQLVMSERVAPLRIAGSDSSLPLQEPSGRTMKLENPFTDLGRVTPQRFGFFSPLTLGCNTFLLDPIRSNSCLGYEGREITTLC